MASPSLALLLPVVLFAAKPHAPPPKRPVLALHEVRVASPTGGQKRVRFASPRGWTRDEDRELGSLRLVGPEGEGEILIVVATHPSQLGPHLTHLKDTHPATTPSPPMAVTVPGIDPEKGERATRFAISGKESGEMVMIERGGVIVLFATLVEPDAWDGLRAVLKKCYPTVEVTDVEEAKR